MKLTVIEAKTIDDAFYQALNACVNDGYEYTIDRGSYAGTKRKELDHVTIRIEYPGTRPLLPILPEGMAAPWDEEYVYSYLDKLMTKIKEPNEEYTYGEYLTDQIEEVIKMYQEDGYNTNQASMAVGDKDSIYQNDPACLRQIDTRIRYGKLHFILYFRSWDLYGGFPANLAGIQLMKELMAEKIGVEDGEIICSSKGLHIYEYAWPLANLRLGRK